MTKTLIWKQVENLLKMNNNNIAFFSHKEQAHDSWSYLTESITVHNTYGIDISQDFVRTPTLAWNFK